MSLVWRKKGRLLGIEGSYLYGRKCLPLVHDGERDNSNIILADLCHRGCIVMMRIAPTRGSAKPGEHHTSDKRTSSNSCPGRLGVCLS